MNGATIFIFICALVYTTAFMHILSSIEKELKAIKEVLIERKIEIPKEKEG